MADRLTIEEFFEALNAQKITPLVDTPEVKASVSSRVRVLCAGYAIQDRWPILDLETAYEQTLNELPNVLDLSRAGYRGTIKLRDFDESYSLDEWFGDFAQQWSLTDSPHIRNAMLHSLPPGETWKSPALWKAYRTASRPAPKSLLRRLLDR
jgi:hypothetical protein